MNKNKDLYLQELIYQKDSYASFNKQLQAGINQGLSLYDKMTDQKLFKDTKKLDDDIKQVQDDIQQDKMKETNGLLNQLDNMLSTIIGGQLGQDAYNYHLYKTGEIDEFESSTLKFYKEPIQEVLNTIIPSYKYELLTILGVTILFFVLIK